MRYRQDGAGRRLTEQPEQPQEQPWHCAVLLLARALPRDRSGRGGHFCQDTMGVRGLLSSPSGRPAPVGILGRWDTESDVSPAVTSAAGG